ncbi:MAG: SBBP repeat-containing protein [Crocinitomicaceae bacterium]|nr:SBBP repeat-containing protein [Crocinitomicaceae bacterium]
MKTLFKIGFYFCLLSNPNVFAQNPEFDWAKIFGHSDFAGYYGFTYGNAIVSDQAGYVYVAGQFTNDAYFDPTGASWLLTSAGVMIFLAKLDGAGNVIWVSQMGGTSTDVVNDIAIDQNGNIYTTGSFKETADFDPSPAVAFELTSSGYEDQYISKLDNNGNFLWAHRFGGTSDETGNSLCIDSQGYIYSTGKFSSLTDFDPSSGTSNLIPTNYFDIFVSKFDPTGNLIWAKKMGGSENEFGTAIVADQGGNIYITGSFFGTVDFDPSSSSYNLTAGANYDIFITNLDASGNFVWAKKIGGVSGHDEPKSITRDFTGNIFITGYFNGSVDFNPGTAVNMLSSSGQEDLFVLKLDANGNYIWAKQIGGLQNECGLGIDTDGAGAVYVTGYFNGNLDATTNPVDFDPGTGTHFLTPSQKNDIFILRLTGGGDYSWAQNYGNVGIDAGQAIYVDQLGYIYTTGTFKSIVDFNYGPGVLELNGYSAPNCFVQKMIPFNLTLSEKELASSSVFYPNPTKNYAELVLEETVTEGVIFVLDSNGKLISKDYHFAGNVLLVDLTNHPIGNYFVLFQNGSKFHFYKLAKN